jgi:hypothetical protein
MAFVHDLRLKASYAPATSAFGQVQVGTMGRSKVLGQNRIEDAKMLRDWRETVPPLARGIALKRRDVANEPFQVGLPKLNERLTSKQESIAAAVEDFLRAPNPQLMNNSWPGLMEPFVDDLYTVGMAGLRIIAPPPRKGKLAIPSALAPLDAARLEFNGEWDPGNPSSPRYLYLPEDGKGDPIGLRNDEAIVVVLYPTTYQETGIAPLRILYQTITAYQDLVRRMDMLQRHGGPTTLVNIAGAGRENLAAIQRRYQN